MRKTFCSYGYATRHRDKSGGDPFIPAFVLSVDPEFFNLAIYRWRADQHREAQRHRYGQPKRGPGLQSREFQPSECRFQQHNIRAISESPDVSASNPRLGEGGSRVVQFGLKLF